MFSNIIPAAGFTAATTSPALLGSALDVLDFLGRHLLWFGGGLTLAALVMVVWGSAREAARQRAINAADREWSATGRPVAGWGPGWAWSGWVPSRTSVAEEQEAVAATWDEDVDLANAAELDSERGAA